jgi:hypothetical protein
MTTITPYEPLYPQFQYLTAITQANPMVATIEAGATQYIPGMLIHFSVPASYGMVQADQITGLITAINGLNITVNVDASQFFPFVLPDPTSIPTPTQRATISPAGCRNIYDTQTEPFH